MIYSKQSLTSNCHLLGRVLNGWGKLNANVGVTAAGSTAGEQVITKHMSFKLQQAFVLL